MATDTTKRDPMTKFQDLLRELFQFDCADLDFGIYRIMNHKRDVVERFVTEKLPAAIDAALSTGTLAQQNQAADRVQELASRILEDWGDDAIGPDGELGPDANPARPIFQRYLEARAAAAGADGRDSTETTIYNHLHAFFSRYYEDGDFISKRRYGSNQRYAIPYNGEEVYLHWANSDQYYVKTEAHFRDYDWNAPNGVAVHFRLRDADLERDNNKGDRRFFLPMLDDAEWNESARSVTVPFEYRPLTAQEGVSYGKQKQQDKIIASAVDGVPQRLNDAPDALAALTGERRRNGKDEPVSHLEHHLRQYTRRNDSDFFIHKDLSGFLHRELDFYLKNEVLNLDNLETAGERAAPGWFQLMRLIKSVGGQIIDFLAQIEGFQKMLWEKRKFVVDTQYCVTLGNVDAAFYPEIAANEPQWTEWQDLFDVDGADRSDKFLRDNPTLVLDTRHFDTDFTDRLLASFDDLDGMTDGLLIHSENWQALRLLEEKCRQGVKCVHIDPPYNTATSGFLYKNSYQHSSWLAMMNNHIAAALRLLESPGSFLCHIDENEYERLHLLFELHFPISNAGTLVWDKRNPMTAGRGIANQHEYVVWRSDTDKSINLRGNTTLMMVNKASDLIQEKGGVTEAVRKEFTSWVTRNSQLSGGEKAYRFLDDEGQIYRGVSLRAPEPRTDPKFFQPLIHPVTGKPCPVPPNGFSRTPETLQGMIERGEILFGADESTQPQQKRFLTSKSVRQLTSVMQDARRGKPDLDALGVENFPYCHAVGFYEELIGAASDASNDIVLDYFAGSGTTGHAVINLNREDGGERKFILVEMGDYFHTVLLPRVKKVTFSPEWSAGKPKRKATPEEAERSPRIVKYVRLESYEDALDGIAFDEQAAQLRLEERIEGYLLRYILKWETKQSKTLLNAASLTRPFDYRLQGRSNGVELNLAADIPETFNYLLGLNVKTRRVYDRDGQRYVVYRGETRQSPGREVVVIWRATEGWTDDEFRRDERFVAENGLAKDADVIYVNGDSVIEGAKPIEPLFKQRMFAGVDL